MDCLYITYDTVFSLIKIALPNLYQWLRPLFAFIYDMVLRTQFYGARFYILFILFWIFLFSLKLNLFIYFSFLINSSYASIIEVKYPDIKIPIEINNIQIIWYPSLFTYWIKYFFKKKNIANPEHIEHTPSPIKLLYLFLIALYFSFKSFNTFSSNIKVCFFNIL